LELEITKIKKKQPNQNKKFKQPKGLPRVSPYYMALKHPDIVQGPKVPHQFQADTLTMHRHVSVPITTNATGLLAGVFQPYFLAATGTNTSVLGIQNNVAYNGTTTFTGGFVSQVMNYVVTANTVQGYRLVSACMDIIPQFSMLTLGGKIGAQILNYNTLTPVVPPAALNTDVDLQTIGAISTGKPYIEAQLNQQEYIRMVYYPVDIHDYELYNINATGDITNSTDTTFNFYVSGVPAASPFNLEIYLNYELTPNAGNTLVGMNYHTSSVGFPEPSREVELFKTDQRNYLYVVKQGVQNGYDMQRFYERSYRGINREINYNNYVGNNLPQDLNINDASMYDTSGNFLGGR
jgi:hypothetical protein